MRLSQRRNTYFNFLPLFLIKDAPTGFLKDQYVNNDLEKEKAN